MNGNEFDDEDTEARRILKPWGHSRSDAGRPFRVVAAYARRLEADGERLRHELQVLQRMRNADIETFHALEARIAAARTHIEQAAGLALGHEAWPAIADAYAALVGEPQAESQTRANDREQAGA